ncbi:GIY-YIG nuclease family protein [Marinobacter sp. NFXS11]|uniref:GIY-YIG nuclease family protein n=1 Tax=Marinobacter sp. NFXS11 TaxID=2818432 RepID=UPI0032DFD3EB
MAYLYILSNKSMPGLLKVGMTTNSPQERAAQLSTTGVPGEFVVEEYWECSPDDLRKSERDIHRTLNPYRYQKNREFFKISLEKARSEIEGYFKKISNLQIEREQRREIAAAKEARIQRALEIRRQLEGEIIDGVNELVNRINEKSKGIESQLERIVPAEQVVRFIYPSKKKEMNGRLVSHSGWELKSTFLGFNRGKIPRELQEDQVKIYIFIAVTTKPLFGETRNYGGFFAVSYMLHSGKIESLREDANVVNDQFGHSVFPKTLAEFFSNLGFEDLANEWKNRFGEFSRLKQEVKEGLQCPSCADGNLVMRRRKRDGQPFLGCSSWPSCNFTFNAQSPDAGSQR